MELFAKKFNRWQDLSYLIVTAWFHDLTLSGSKVALDVGTGTGQVAAEIAPKFLKVIGEYSTSRNAPIHRISTATDPSQSMLDAATQKGYSFPWVL